MKKLFSKSVLFCFLTMLISGTAFSANEYYRSIASGNWNATGTWQMSTNSGGTWIAATGAPTDTSGVITIQSLNTVTVTVSVNADQLVINSGGANLIKAAVFFEKKKGGGDDLVFKN